MTKPSLIERLRAKKVARTTVMGVVWYTEEDWGLVKAAATDPERFEQTYAEWVAMVTKAIADLKKTGVSVVQFDVVPKELLAWCAQQKLPNNAASRARFVSDMMRLQAEASADLLPKPALKPTLKL